VAFALQRSEPVADGARRVLDELLTGAIAALDGGGDVATAVHEARKATKRVRAVVRLMRPAIRAKDYRNLNRGARDAARALAGARDAHVAAATFDALVATANDPTVYMGLRAQLPADDDPAPSTEALATAVQGLDTVRTRSQRLSLDDPGWSAVGPGLAAMYRRGAKGMSTAAGKPSAARLHQWRKHTKYLWHATELLTPAWPAVVGPFSAELHALSDSLGDDHDLDVLSVLVADRGLAVPAGWADLVAQRHAQLRSAAFSRGLRCYAEPAAAFTDRMRSYVAAWLAG
jgi:CHAD domain-containing protein